MSLVTDAVGWGILIRWTRSKCFMHLLHQASKEICENLGWLAGEIITFDQLALRAPTGKNTLMIQGEKCKSNQFKEWIERKGPTVVALTSDTGPRKSREAQKHFGAAGRPGSHVKPFTRSRFVCKPKISCFN